AAKAHQVRVAGQDVAQRHTYPEEAQYIVGHKHTYRLQRRLGRIAIRFVARAGLKISPAALLVNPLLLRNNVEVGESVPLGDKMLRLTDIDRVDPGKVELRHRLIGGNGIGA